MSGGKDPGASQRDDYEEELAAAGVAPEEVDAAFADESDEEGADRFELWDLNLPALNLFAELWTQWRAVAGMDGVYFLGLDYDTAINVMRRKRGEQRVQDIDQMLGDLRVMERVALPLRNERVSPR